MSPYPSADPRRDPYTLASTSRLGPYQVEYDVRRGYEEEAPAAPAAALRDPVWVGRRRDER